MISLEGNGWLYIGLDGEETGNRREQGIEFLSTEYSGNHNSFSFETAEYGQYLLRFQLQDARRGTVQNEYISLKVVPDDEFTALVAAVRDSDSTQEEPQNPYAEKLFAIGEWEAALTEFLKNYQDGNPQLNDRIATVYAAMGAHEAALKYYSKNLETADAYAERAVLGLVRSSVALGDEKLLADYLETFLGANTTGRDLLNVARFQGDSGHAAVALDMYQEYLKRFPWGDQLDEVYFRLARLYELDLTQRDLEKSRSYYQKVYDEYPESLYSDESRQRLRYLERYFFRIH